MMLEAVIFDMDGVIIDSHSVSHQLLSDAARALGCSLSGETIRAWGSLSSRQFWLKVRDEFDLECEISQLIANYDTEREIELYKNMSPVCGVVELINSIRAEGIGTALATSASERRMKAVLEVFGIHHLFDPFLCDEDVSNSKPDPEIYLEISERSGWAPAACVAVEDSQNGIIAAKRAGMKCIGYTGPPGIDEDLSEADLLIGDFRPLTPDDIVGLFAAEGPS